MRGFAFTDRVRGAFRSVRFLLDRRLGANRVAPKEEPAQRDFNIYNVYQDMAKRVLTIDGFRNAQLQVTPLKDDFGLLTPSIKFISTFKFTGVSMIFIAGMFGSTDGGTPLTVTLNGQELDVMTRFPSLIMCQDIPTTGPNASGEVLVEVGSAVGGATSQRRESNPVNITEWTVPLQYVLDDPDTLTSRFDLNIVIRADIHPFRDKPGEPPYETMVVFCPNESSTGSEEASGIWQLESSGCTIGFTYGGAFTFDKPPVNSFEQTWMYDGTVDYSNRRVNLNLTVSGLFDGGTEFVSGPPECNPFTVPYSPRTQIESCAFHETENRIIMLPMNTDYSIAAGEHGCQIPWIHDSRQMTSAKITWQDASAVNPPDTGAAQ